MSDLQRRYGEALFKIAHEEQADEVLKSDLEEILKHFHDKENISAFLSSMNENLFSSFDEIFEGFAKQYDEKHNTITVFVTSAYALSKEEIDMLEEKLEQLTQKKAHIISDIDPGLLGGMVLKLNGQEIDGSLKTKLNQIKKEIVQ